MIKKTLVRVWDIIRKHRTAFLIGTLLPSIIGLFLAEAVMAVQFNALQPILGGMTFLTVEALGAWLVDFPLSVLAGCIITKKVGASKPTYGALAGAAFLTVFILLVASVGGGLRQFTTFFDVFGLGDAVLIAAQTARQQLGFHLGVIVFMFLISDYFLCMLGGILGFNIIRFVYPSAAKES